MDKTPLKIHRNAFSSSRKTLTFLSIQNCNLAHLNFSFLNNFEILGGLSFADCLNVSKATWDDMPHLPSLKNVLISSDPLNWNLGIDIIQTWSKGLTEIGLSLEVENFHDDLVNQILHWMFHYSAINTSVAILQPDEICNPILTQIPRQTDPLDFTTLKSAMLIGRNSTIDVLITIGSSFGLDNDLSLADFSSRNPARPGDMTILNFGISEIQHGLFQGIIENIYRIK